MTFTKGVSTRMDDPTNDPLWKRLDKLTALKLEMTEALKKAYGALTGTAYVAYIGKGGPARCHKDAIKACGEVLAKVGVSKKSMRVEARMHAAAGHSERILSTREVAAMMGIHPHTLANRIKQGIDHPPAFKWGSQWRFRESEFLKWVRAQEVRVPTPKKPKVKKKAS